MPNPTTSPTATDKVIVTNPALLARHLHTTDMENAALWDDLKPAERSAYEGRAETLMVLALKREGGEGGFLSLRQMREALRTDGDRLAQMLYETRPAAHPDGPPHGAPPWDKLTPARREVWEEQARLMIRRLADVAAAPGHTSGVFVGMKYAEIAKHLMAGDRVGRTKWDRDEQEIHEGRELNARHFVWPFVFQCQPESFSLPPQERGLNRVESPQQRGWHVRPILARVVTSGEANDGTERAVVFGWKPSEEDVDARDWYVVPARGAVGWYEDEIEQHQAALVDRWEQDGRPGPSPRTIAEADASRGPAQTEQLAAALYLSEYAVAAGHTPAFARVGDEVRAQYRSRAEKISALLDMGHLEFRAP